MNLSNHSLIASAWGNYFAFQVNMHTQSAWVTSGWWARWVEIRTITIKDQGLGADHVFGCGCGCGGDDRAGGSVVAVIRRRQQHRLPVVVLLRQTADTQATHRRAQVTAKTTSPRDGQLSNINGKKSNANKKKKKTFLTCLIWGHQNEACSKMRETSPAWWETITRQS